MEYDLNNCDRIRYIVNVRVVAYKRKIGCKAFQSSVHYIIDGFFFMLNAIVESTQRSYYIFYFYVIDTAQLLTANRTHRLNAWYIEIVVRLSYVIVYDLTHSL